MTANIHLVGGEKGGVAQIAGGAPAGAILHRPFPAVHRLRFRTERMQGIDALLRGLRLAHPHGRLRKPRRHQSEAATEEPGRRILVDLAAQTNEGIDAVDGGFAICWRLRRRSGLSMRYWHASWIPGATPSSLLKRLLDKHGTRFSYTLVLNRLRGGDFRILDNSGEKERAIGMGAGVVTLKRLHEITMNKIDAGSLNFWAAINKNEGDTSGLRLLERQRVKVWLKNAYTEIAKQGV